jgi:hypothetical protein
VAKGGDRVEATGRGCVCGSDLPGAMVEATTAITTLIYTYIYNNICDVYNSNMATLLYCKRDHYGIMDRNEFKY